MTDRPELERAIAKRLCLTYGKALPYQPVILVWDDVTKNAWLAVAREAMAMMERVGEYARQSTHMRALDRPVDLSPALEKP